MAAHPGRREARIHAGPHVQPASVLTIGQRVREYGRAGAEPASGRQLPFVALVGRMDFQTLLKWWAGKRDRVPLPGRVTDYAALVGRYNRSLVSVAMPFANGIANPANTNRVGLYVYAHGFSQVTVQAQVDIRLLQPDGVTTALTSDIAAKEADVALVTPTTPIYVPFRETILTLGPLIRNAYIIDISGGNLFASVIEVLINPEMDSSEL